VFEKEEKHSFNEWLKLSQAKPIQRSSETKNNLQKKVSLIEDFIANRERTPKKEFYSASNKAKESVEFHFDIVTETLAKVYLEQGHYEKAKAAYKQLSLKYPQKSSLFASQIGLIDQLITKNK
jgi:thioredoxin-like negative regulator of GroEL